MAGRLLLGNCNCKVCSGIPILYRRAVVSCMSRMNQADKHVERYNDKYASVQERLSILFTLGFAWWFFGYDRLEGSFFLVLALQVLAVELIFMIMAVLLRNKETLNHDFEYQRRTLSVMYVLKIGVQLYPSIVFLFVWLFASLEGYTSVLYLLFTLLLFFIRPIMKRWFESSPKTAT